MKKTSEEKAITLIALIITIVVLLILAVVAINAVTGDGIIQHATNAKTQYEEAQDEEQDVLSYYGEYLATEGNAGTWKQEEDYIINNEDVKIPIGAIVDYVPETGKQYISYSNNSGYSSNQTFTVKDDSSMKWIVIGEEYGKIKLLASKAITHDSDTDNKGYVLAGINGSKNGIEELDRIASIYGTGSYAESSRSIKENDIIGLSDITENDKEGSNNAFYEYGAKYTYMYDETNSLVIYKKNDGDYTSLQRESLLLPDGTQINSENKGPKVIVSNHYGINFTGKRNENIIINSDEYWIASNSITVTDGGFNDGTRNFVAGDFYYGFRFIGANNVSYGIGSSFSFCSPSGGIENTSGYKVRPVVILNANTQLQADGKDENGTSKYKIV